MRLTQLTTTLAIAAIAGLAPLAATTATAASPAPGTAHATASCLLVTATVPVPNDTGNVAVDPKTNTIYTVGDDQNKAVSELYVISGQTNAVVDTIPLPGGADGVTVDPGTDTVYATSFAAPSGGKGSITVINGATNKVVATLPRGSQLLNPALDTALQRMYLTNFPQNQGGDGVLLILNGPSYRHFVKQISVGFDAAPIGVDPQTARIYVSSRSGVTVINGKTNTVAATIAVSTPPTFKGSGLAVNAVTNRIYVGGSGSEVSVINGATNKVAATIAVPGQEITLTVAVNPATDAVYAASWPNSFQDGQVSVINGKTNSIVTTATVGVEPQGIATDPATRNVYAVNNADGTMSILHDSCTL